MLVAQRTIDKARLTKAAAAQTAALNLQHRAVVDDVDERYNKLFWIVYLVQIGNDSFGHLFRCLRTVGLHRVDGAVLAVADVVQAWNIHAADLCCLLQKALLVPALFFCLHIQVGQLDVDLLALTDDEDVDEVCHRLRVAGAGTTRYHHRRKGGAVLRAHRHPCQVKHIEDGGVAHLILHGKQDKIKVADRVQAFQPVQRDILFPHQLLHVRIRCKDALAPPVFPLVVQGI